jgi:hypothetical protein
LTKFSLRQKSSADKILASTKISHQQNCANKNLMLTKILASTKILRRQKSSVDKKLVSTKCWRRPRRIPLLFGSAESIAADFYQTSLKISFVSQMALHAVAKCGVASARIAFMGGLSPTLYRLIVLARHAENVTNFGANKIWLPKPCPPPQVGGIVPKFRGIAISHHVAGAAGDAKCPGMVHQVVPLPRYVTAACCADITHVSNRQDPDFFREISGPKRVFRMPLQQAP